MPAKRPNNPIDRRGNPGTPLPPSGLPKDSNNNMLFDTRPTLGLPACYGTIRK